MRRLYEELHNQLLMKDSDVVSDDDDGSSFEASNHNGGGRSDGSSRGSSFGSVEGKDGEKDSLSAVNALTASHLAKSRRRFQGGELEGMKEDMGRILTKRKILICLDDVWRLDDVKWFIFDPRQSIRSGTPEPRISGDVNNVNEEDPCPFRILMTTRIPSLLGHGIGQEVFVRIFSEHEAVKLLLSSAGRRVYGGKSSPVFTQARVIVKGCGNSPLALRLAGGMLRSSNRNWTLSSSCWRLLLDQAKSSLEEASKIRSFINSVGRIVDLSFITVPDLYLRSVLRRCFVAFAMEFRDNELVKVGKGIPKTVVLNLFSVMMSVINHDDSSAVSPEAILETLETMNLLQKARHGAKVTPLLDEETFKSDDSDSQSFEPTNPAASPAAFDDVVAIPCYLMHESVSFSCVCASCMMIS